jgi:hypothetical protein
MTHAAADTRAGLEPDRSPREPRWRPWAAEARRWGVSIVLLLPAAIPYFAHFATSKPYSRPTGYVQPDMPIYMAKAREYFDSGQFSPTYSNPCSDSYREPRIYFQPWTLALGAAQWFSGLSPRLLFVGFWVVSALCCARVALGLYRELVGLDSRAARHGLVIFFWGGGLLAICGAALALLTKGRVTNSDLFALDPVEGWWFLNFGRNLVYPTESLYHALVFGCILCLLRGHRAWALVLALITAASTPFTGFELVAVLWTWSAIEVGFMENPEGLKPFFVGVSLIAIAFVAYYAVFLNLFPEHRLIASQMSLNWGYSAATFVPAEALVAALALWRIRNYRLAGAVVRSSRNRLLLVWFLVAFALANHEFAVSPRQPIHFDRGYVWTALFFLGAPVLLQLLTALQIRLSRTGARIATVLVLGLFLSDNIAWFASYIAAFHSRVPADIRLKDEEREVLDRLNDPALFGDLLISDDRSIGYLAIAETPLRSWTAHWLETPHFRERERQLDDLFLRGRFAPEWNDRRLLIVVTRGPNVTLPPPWLAERAASLIFEDRKFAIYRVAPRPATRRVKLPPANPPGGKGAPPGDDLADRTEAPGRASQD